MLALNYSNAACASTQSPAKADTGSSFQVEKPKMSTVLQPATSGKVVLKTTVGDIDVELWPKEAPMACRNFVQLCMEGYYDNCIFHRIIRKVCAQTGDPTGSGDGGESAYGTPFDSEPHSRLRFMHRGLVAMAGTGKESNGSQFFFTLAETRWLDGKHTIFGKVTGNTIYNMDALGDLEVDADDRPLYPPRIIGAEVINNPFNDIVPREAKRSTVEEVVKVKVKGKLNTNLLSFQDDVEDEDASAADAAKFKIRSAHDVSDSNGRLAREALNVKAMPQVQRRVGKIVDESSDEEEESSRGKQHEVDLGASALQGEHGKEERQAALMRLKEEIRELKKKSLVGAESQPAVGKALVANKRGREAQTLEKLGQFKSGLSAFLTSVQPLPKVSDKDFELQTAAPGLAPSTAVTSIASLTENGLEKGFLTETLDDYDDSGWRENTLVFTKQPRKEAPNYDNHYMVLDPMKEKKEGKRNSAKLSKWEKGGPLL